MQVNVEPPDSFKPILLLSMIPTLQTHFVYLCAMCMVHGKHKIFRAIVFFFFFLFRFQKYHLLNFVVVRFVFSFLLKMPIFGERTTNGTAAYTWTEHLLWPFEYISISISKSQSKIVDFISCTLSMCIQVNII